MGLRFPSDPLALRKALQGPYRERSRDTRCEGGIKHDGHVSNKTLYLQHALLVLVPRERAVGLVSRVSAVLQDVTVSDDLLPGTKLKCLLVDQGPMRLI